MYEKFSNLNVDSSGSGGEYTVQAGFGWTNGVVLWVAANYGGQLVAPECPALVVDASTTASANGAVGMKVSPGTVLFGVVAVVTLALFW